MKNTSGSAVSMSISKQDSNSETQASTNSFSGANRPGGTGTVKLYPGKTISEWLERPPSTVCTTCMRFHVHTKNRARKGTNALEG